MRRLITISLALGALALAPSAQGATTSVFGSDLPCTPQDGGVRLCSGVTHSFDGTKIDASVILPPAPLLGPDGPYPTIGFFHGWGGSKIELTDRTRAWATKGYAVFSMSDRGWGNSCGAADPDRLSAQCSQGYNHLMDDRYEVRDAQYLISLLADEGVTKPTKVGAGGGSYGGGLSMALAALRDRVMLPDGSLAPWRSPGGKAMRIAAAAPEIPWTDLANSLLPNGRTLDYVADAPYGNRIGVMKLSFVSGLFATGLASSNFATPGTDPDADVISWYGLISAGEPYDQNPLAADITDEVTTHHSSYYIDHTQPPAPLLISNGWTDDLFPPDEAVRFYNRTRTQFGPSANVNLFFMDFGHQRGQNKPADTDRLHAREDAWFDYYLRGVGSAPPSGRVETLTKTCGSASGGPFTAANWGKVASGEVRYDSAAGQTILPLTGDPVVGQAFDPITGGGACATASGADQPGIATYRLPAATGSGYTLLGSPTVVADINSIGPTSQIAARLLDVAPDGNETLVARALYRPEVNSGLSPTRQVFQLHPVGWKFAPGHVAKLELLPNDVPYGRLSNGQLLVSVSNLQLRLPVRESANGTTIKKPAAKVLPAGYTLARDFR